MQVFWLLRESAVDERIGMRLWRLAHEHRDELVMKIFEI